MPLVYPHDFIQRIKSEYPNHRDIHLAADSGSYILGKFLAEGASQQMAAEAVVSAFSESRADLVLENAKTVVRRKALHVTWLKIMSKKISSLDEVVGR